MRNLITGVSIAITLVVSFSVHAEAVYKWIDEDGQIHYSSKPNSKHAKEVKIKKRSINTNKSSGQTTEERVNQQNKFLNALDAENKSIAEQKRIKREKEEDRITRCNASRDQLKRAEDASALYDLDEKGDRILLDKKQYEIAMAQARARVEKWCN